ncbi:MAG: hypothetical protein NC517_00940 [Firmicutes bacterium]|nr:hypothetical protein [Bacillota bacterium]
MEENKRKAGWKFFLAEGAIIIAGTFGMGALGRIRQQQEDRLLGNCVMMLLILAVICFHLRREYVHDSLDYDNGEHIFRFFLCLGIGLAVAFACGFLPVAGWPFLPVFIMFSLFSNMSVGLLSATALLLIPVLLGGGDAGGFALYFVSGVFAVTLFRHLGEDFKIGIPLFLSMLCLLVCETANVVLVANARPDFEMFVIPTVNMIVSGVLLLGCLKMFSSTVVYRHREKYLDIIDSENPVIARMRERDRDEYMHCVHTTYFCERIGQRLGLQVEALKSAGYYYRLGGELTQMLEDEQFPPNAKEILLDYRNRQEGMKKKETAVLYCSDMVVTSVKAAIESGEPGQVDIDRLIDDIFNKLFRNKIFDKCDISLGELKTMQQIFKEEKLYYDFLR